MCMRKVVSDLDRKLCQYIREKVGKHMRRCVGRRDKLLKQHLTPIQQTLIVTVLIKPPRYRLAVPVLVNSAS